MKKSFLLASCVFVALAINLVGCGSEGSINEKTQNNISNKDTYIESTEKTEEGVSDNVEIDDKYTLTMNSTFAYDEAGQEYVVQQSYMLHEDFHEYISGVGEADIYYVYLPNATDASEYATDEDAGENCRLAIYDTLSNQMHNAINEYEKTGKAPEGYSITENINDTVKYCVKTVYPAGNYNEYSYSEVQATFYVFEKELNLFPSAFVAEIPENKYGSEEEQLTMAALEVLSSTFEEEAILSSEFNDNEWY